MQPCPCQYSNLSQKHSDDDTNKLCKCDKTIAIQIQLGITYSHITSLYDITNKIVAWGRADVSMVVWFQLCWCPDNIVATSIILLWANYKHNIAMG